MRDRAASRGQRASRGRPPARHDNAARGHYEDRGYHENQHDPYYREPPPAKYSHRPPHRPHYTDYDRPEDRYDSGYHFRGAAVDYGDARPPQHEFSFRPPHHAPAFPPEDRRPPPRSLHPPTGPRNSSNRSQGAKNQPSRGARDSAPRKFVRKAIVRPLFDQRREPTPELLEGMQTSKSGAIFKAVDDIPSSSSDEEGPDAKRAKYTGANDQPAWSTAEFVLDQVPEAEPAIPKKNILHDIRKAKTASEAASSKATSVKAAPQFMSFDMMDADDVDDESEVLESNDSGPLSEDGEVRSRNTSSTRSHDQSRDPPRTTSTSRPTFTAINERIAVDNVDNPRKRKRLQRQDPTIEPEWQPFPSTDSTPWYREATESCQESATRLHMEVCEFWDWVQPSHKDQIVRADIIARVSRVISTWSKVSAAHQQISVHPFGSFASGLYLPTADMDLVAISSDYVRTGMPTFCQNQKDIRGLAAWIGRSGMTVSGSMDCIPWAKVPLIKWVDAKTGIPVDLSFDNASGLMAVTTLQKWKEEFPSMQPVVVLIKQLVAMYGQNQVHSGGIGGFTIICLVVSMMQQWNKISSGGEQSQQSYGDWLMSFLELYGVRFDYRKTGILMRNPDWFDKTEIDLPGAQDDRLTIMDPNREGHDIAGGTRNIEQIFDIFSLANSRLRERLTDIKWGDRLDESILGVCWAANYSSYEDQRRKINAAYLEVMRRGGPPPILPVPSFSAALVLPAKPIRPFKRRRPPQRR